MVSGQRQLYVRGQVGQRRGNDARKWDGEPREHVDIHGRAERDMGSVCRRCESLELSRIHPGDDRPSSCSRHRALRGMGTNRPSTHSHTWSPRPPSTAARVDVRFRRVGHASQDDHLRRQASALLSTKAAGHRASNTTRDHHQSRRGRRLGASGGCR